MWSRLSRYGFVNTRIHADLREAPSEYRVHSTNSDSRLLEFIAVGILLPGFEHLQHANLPQRFNRITGSHLR
jgi:hypothetical protein